MLRNYFYVVPVSSYVGSNPQDCFARGLLKGLEARLVPVFQGWSETATCISTEGKCPDLSKQGGNLLFFKPQSPHHSIFPCHGKVCHKVFMSRENWDQFSPVTSSQQRGCVVIYPNTTYLSQTPAQHERNLSL